LYINVYSSVPERVASYLERTNYEFLKVKGLGKMIEGGGRGDLIFLDRNKRKYPVSEEGKGK
jgi:hypothetical protein